MSVDDFAAETPTTPFLEINYDEATAALPNEPADDRPTSEQTFAEKKPAPSWLTRSLVFGEVARRHSAARTAWAYDRRNC
jgi:hypothetical protein